MTHIANQNLDYDRPVQLADDVYWAGFTDPAGGLQCNPYLIIDGDEAVLIDGGSRPDFPTIMMKIMQTGLAPDNISTLIYQHYDPDLCGSIPNLEDIINRGDLRILSHRANNTFIRHYAVKSKLQCIDTIGRELKLKSGRILRFFKTPYSHSAGSFITYDEKTGILFTSDILGSFSDGKMAHELFLSVPEICYSCDNKKQWDDSYDCEEIKDKCPMSSFYRFHRKVMTSNKALRHALEIIQEINPKMAAPQHGSIIHESGDFTYLLHKLMQLDDIGIDGVINEK